MLCASERGLVSYECDAQFPSGSSPPPPQDGNLAGSPHLSSGTLTTSPLVAVHGVSHRVPARINPYFLGGLPLLQQGISPSKVGVHGRILGNKRGVGVLAGASLSGIRALVPRSLGEPHIWSICTSERMPRG